MNEVPSDGAYTGMKPENLIKIMSNEAKWRELWQTK